MPRPILDTSYDWLDLPEENQEGLSVLLKYAKVQQGLRKNMSFPYALRLEELEDIGIDDEHKESLAEEFSKEMFSYIKPGVERACIVLRAEGFTHPQIAFVLGITENKSSKVLGEIRKRLIAAGIGRWK